MIVRWVMLLAIGLPAPAWAHGGTGGPPGRWLWETAPLLVMTLLGLGYALGVRRLWRRLGPGRGIARSQAVAGALGGLSFLVALSPPVDRICDQLGWAHMTQHMVLMLVAAPLLVIALPGWAWPWASPGLWRRLGRWRLLPMPGRGPWYWLVQPLVAWSLFAGALWVWHWPPLYEAALHRPGVHALQHLVFFTTACGFWYAVCDPVGRRRLGPAAALAYLFATSLHASLLGGLMTLAPRPWYPTYAGTVGAWGLTALEDQQLGGLIMWVPACLVYAVVAAWVLLAWLQAPMDAPEAQ